MKTDRDSAQHPGSRLKTVLLFVLKAIVTVSAFAWVFHQINTTGLIGGFESLSLPWLLAGITVLFLHFGIMVWRWSYVLQRICGLTVPYLRLTFVFGLGELIGAFFPSFIGIDVTRTLAMGTAAPMAKVLESVVIDRVLGLVALLIFIALCLPAFALRFGTGPIFLAMCLVSIGGLLACLLSLRLSSLVSKLPFVGGNLAQSMRSLALTSTKKKLLFVTLGSGILMHVLAVAIFWAAANMLGLDLGFGDCMLIAPGALLIASLPISLGGWGVREGALVAGFGLIGADPATVTAASICYGVSGMISGAAGVGLSAAFGGTRRLGAGQREK